MANRDYLISLLEPVTQGKCRNLLQLCVFHNIPILITCTLRTFAEQCALFAKGRDKNGMIINIHEIVTRANGGHSWHNYGRAFDIVPLIDGKPWWDAPSALWLTLGELGESIGLEWGGRFPELVDRPHFQFRNGLTIAQALAIHESVNKMNAT